MIRLRLSLRARRTAGRVASVLRLSERPLRWGYAATALSALGLVLDYTVGPTWLVPIAGFHASSMVYGAAIICLCTAAQSGLLSGPKGGRQ